MCSIIYELLISTVSSYFLGDSVRQFSIIIGFYLAAMGLGSWLSRYFVKDLMFSFIWIEIILGLVGAFSVPLCYIYFSYADFEGFNIFILGLIIIIGTLTGLEVPILTQLLQGDKLESKELSDVLTLDYIGALVATLIFPFVLIPFMGVYKSSLLFGFLNIFIGVANFIFFRSMIERTRKRDAILWTVSISFIALIGFAGFRANQFIDNWNTSVFKHPVVYNESTPYQNIILTDNGAEFRLYLNSAIQFSSRDEYRYHEALVHVGGMQLPNVKHVAILGGGEGLALREVLKYPELESVSLIELDPEIIEISKEFSQIRTLNEDALSDPKVDIINDDAFVWLMANEKKFDLIIADLPDPTNESLSRLYSISFYNLVQNSLNEGGAFVTQATSPELSPSAFWCIEKSMIESGFKKTYPYSINVPSFGNWGFVLASKQEMDFAIRPELELKFLEAESFDHIFYFPSDIKVSEVESNRLDRPVIMKYYLKHWRSLHAEKI
ncbi:polyamine aminopropyltransferase 1 [Portibacter lacus]|uniref:Polyamine aminopropyltransferase n=2 Tax=Portibacter lacus TaxID=1099794 RepID=A0AA37WED8_9BACT|nr:polyamine aminopropyltransferase 1 [Portibacter lacus]